MIIIARIFAALQILFLAGVVLGAVIGPEEEVGDVAGVFIFALPLLYMSLLTWKALEPVALSKIKFILAHIPPLALLFVGLILLLGSKHVSDLIPGGLFMAAAVFLFWQIHVRRKIAFTNAAP